MKRVVLAGLFALSALHASKMEEGYQFYSEKTSDINEHLPVLRQVASECASVVEIGLREMVSSWGLISGLIDSPYPEKRYLGIDIAGPDYPSLQRMQKAVSKEKIAFEVWTANDMHIDIPEVDLLFIDTLHTYCHLTYELEKFSSKAQKYIVMHDTSEPWGDQNEDIYKGDYSEYPDWIDRTKQGLWPAVVDFLERHPEWTLQERRLNNHGLTILKRL